MSRVERLVSQLEVNYSGEPWHGSSVRTILESVTEQKAHARPGAGDRTISELLAHLTAWNEIVERRAGGEAVEVTVEMDFPAVGGMSWAEQCARLDDAHARLVARVRSLTDAQLDQQAAGKNYTIDFMIDGLMHHNTYHAAQIALLRK